MEKYKNQINHINAYIKQYNIINADSLKNSLSICIQFTPLWVMILLNYVSEYQFAYKEYISTILVFDIVTCATIMFNIVNKQIKFWKEWQIIILTFSLQIILCFSSVLYCLLLIDMLSTQKVNQIKIFIISLFLTICVTIIYIFSGNLNGNSKGA